MTDARSGVVLYVGSDAHVLVGWDDESTSVLPQEALLLATAPESAQPSQQAPKGRAPLHRRARTLEEPRGQSPDRVDEAAAERALAELLAEQRRYYRERGRPSTTTGGCAATPTRSTPRAKPVGSRTCKSSRLRSKRSGRGGEVLELAAGTGVWTEQLLRLSERVTAVDAVAEVLELNRARTGGAAEYLLADLFAWQPPRRFDVCFFGFWLCTFRAGSSTRSGSSSVGR